MSRSLWLMASAVADVFVSGEQADVVVRPTDRPFDTGRMVHVSDGSIEWIGPLTEWRAALTECLARPAMPGSIRGWEPGPIESSANA